MSFSNRLTITQGPLGTGKLKKIVLFTCVFLKKGVLCKIIGHSNKSINVPILRLVKKLVANNKRHLLFATRYLRSDIRSVRHWSRKNNSYLDNLRARQLFEALLINLSKPFTEIERACLIAYLDEQLTSTKLNLFSLTTHIKRRLQIVALYNYKWPSIDIGEVSEYRLLKQLSFAHKLIES